MSETPVVIGCEFNEGGSCIGQPEDCFPDRMCADFVDDVSSPLESGFVEGQEPGEHWVDKPEKHLTLVNPDGEGQ